MAASKITLKLLIDTNGKRVLFAEAGKDFVDFLFHIFSLPVGTVVKLIKNDSSLDRLHQSLEALKETYMQPDHQNKDSLLNPKAPLCASGIPLLLSDDVSKSPVYYTCSGHSYSNCYNYVTDFPNMRCPTCSGTMCTQMSYVAKEPQKTGTEAEGGFVKGLMTYMVMDNLEVVPASTISCITMLTKFHVKDLGQLEEKTVEFGFDEGVKLLRLSMESKSVLTSIFL